MQRRPTLLASLTGSFEASKATSLDEVKVFRAVLHALLLTILLSGVLWFNFMLLGDFFFVYFISFVTSVYLRQIKHSIAASLEHAVQNPFNLVKASLLVTIGSEMRQFNFWTISETINRVIDDRRAEKKTMFNDGKTVLSLLFIYVGLSRLGTQRIVVLLLFLGFMEMLLKLAADITIWFLYFSGLTHKLILDKNSKLLPCHHNIIASGVCALYFLVCSGAVMVMIMLVAMDLQRLQTHTIGLLPWDKI